MIRTILWYIFFWAYMLISPILSIPIFILSIPGLEPLKKAYIYILVSSWSRNINRAAGAKVSVKGLENIPKGNKLCFIANHQGGFDIPLILGYMPRTIGFIAKKELNMIPILNIWMRAIGCIFINRANKRDSLEVINKGAEQIKRGHSMIIFPEGTRSQNDKMNRFKSGSLKLPIRSGAFIIPVTIDGSYKLKELNKGLIRPGKVNITIHKALKASNFSEDNTQELAEKLRKIISSSLPA